MEEVILTSNNEVTTRKTIIARRLTKKLVDKKLIPESSFSLQLGECIKMTSDSLESLERVVDRF